MVNVYGCIVHSDKVRVHRNIFMTLDGLETFLRNNGWVPGVDKFWVSKEFQDARVEIIEHVFRSDGDLV